MNERNRTGKEEVADIKTKALMYAFLKRRNKEVFRQNAIRMERLAHRRDNLNWRTVILE